MKQTSSANSGAAVDDDRGDFEGIFVRWGRWAVGGNQLAADCSVALVDMILEVEEHFWTFWDVEIGPLAKRVRIEQQKLSRVTFLKAKWKIVLVWHSNSISIVVLVKCSSSRV